VKQRTISTASLKLLGKGRNKGKKTKLESDPHGGAIRAKWKRFLGYLKRGNTLRYNKPKRQDASQKDVEKRRQGEGRAPKRLTGGGPVSLAHD